MRQILARLKRFFFISLLLVTTTLSAQNKDQELRIGVRAINGIEKANHQWAATAAALSQKIPGYHFSLVPIIDFAKMRRSVKNKNIDFVLTSPLAYADLNKRYGATRILTLNKKQADGLASSFYSSVIFTHSDNADINTLSDIKDKSIMGVHPEAFGGWKMVYRELLFHGIDPYEDSSDVKFSDDNSHQSVINAVLNKTVDIGVVRSSIIEQLIAENNLAPNKLKIINQQQDKLSSIHSTRLYPEWPFSVLGHVDSILSNKVFHALLEIEADSKAAIDGRYINWQAPLDYSEVNQLIADIKYRHITLSNLWHEETELIFLCIGFLIAILVYTLYLFSINRKLANSKTALYQHQQQLEELVEERTSKLHYEIQQHKQTEQQLARAKLIAEHANNAKSEFLSQMSHEIRTPLNAILGYSQLVRLEAHNNPEILDSTGEILTAGKHLLSLVNEILDLSQIESGKDVSTMEVLNWNEILIDCIGLVKPIANQHSVTIRHLSSGQCPVMADRQRLKQICINLISNAIKYNKPKGLITIDLRLINQCEYQLSIKDTGIGIKDELKDTIFAPFSRALANPGKIEGSGIGLTITKKLVEKMQGQIRFESEYGFGSTFFVTLPAHHEQKKTLTI